MDLVLEVQTRIERNKSHKRELKENGMIPAVVYGKSVGSIPIAVDVKKLKKIVEEAGSNALISMEIKDNGETQKHKVLLKAVQHDPVRHELLHADFHQILLSDRVRTTVPINLVGDAPGVAAGGVLTPLLRRVEVECLPVNIPDSITVNISGLDIGDTVTVADLVLPPDAKITEDYNSPVVTVSAAEKPVEEAEAEEPAVEEPAEEDKEDEGAGER